MTASKRPAARTQARAGTSTKRRQSAGAGGSRLFIVGALVVGAVLVGIAVQASRSSSDTSGPTPPGLTETSGVLVGDEAAPVTVDIYADLLCPACRAFEEENADTLDGLVEKGDIKIRYHVIAFLDRASTNDYSTRSASAAYCAADSEQFSDFITTLYATQPAEGGPGHENDALVQLGSQAGVNGSGFEECVTEEKYAGYAARVTDEANKAGVTSTPTVVVDGQLLEDRTNAGLLAAIQAAA
jgi:protein-disulfide isomerase